MPTLVLHIAHSNLHSPLYSLEFCATLDRNIWRRLARTQYRYDLGGPIGICGIQIDYYTLPTGLARHHDGYLSIPGLPMHCIYTQPLLSHSACLSFERYIITALLGLCRANGWDFMRLRRS